MIKFFHKNGIVSRVEISSQVLLISAHCITALIQIIITNKLCSI